MEKRINFKFLMYFILVVLLLGALAGPAFAHKAILFAWVEGDTVFTQSKLSGGRKAINSNVVVYDIDGNRLLDGKTDKNGEFSFKIPKKSALKIILKASMGHAAEWIIPADEILAAGRAAGDGHIKHRAHEDSKETMKYSAPVGHKTAGSLPDGVYIDPQKLQQMIDTSLDKKLAPITKMLAESRHREPGINEILGGIGYILGLVGIALYIANRRRND